MASRRLAASVRVRKAFKNRVLPPVAAESRDRFCTLLFMVVREVSEALPAPRASDICLPS